MLVDLYPRFHARFSSLSLLSPLVEDFVVWLYAAGYTRRPIRLRVRTIPRVDARLRRRGVHRLRELSRAKLLALVPRDPQDDIYLAAVIRSLALFLDARGVLAALRPTQDGTGRRGAPVAPAGPGRARSRELPTSASSTSPASQV